MKSIFKKLMALGCMTAAVFGFSSCDDELDTNSPIRSR